VEYGTALERTRTALARTNGLPWLGRAVLAVMADERIRRPLLAASRLARPFAGLLAGKSRLGLSMGMLAATRMPLNGAPQRRTKPVVAPDRRTGGREGRAVIFRGCIMDDLFAHVHEATERTLLANGLTLGTISGQGCCGALHAHAGLHDQAKALARHNVQAFRDQPDATIVVNAAGCGAILKDYGNLLQGDPLEREAKSLADRVRDVSEVLAACGPRTGAPLDMSVAVDPACHLQHAQRVIDQPQAVLDAIPGLDVRSPHNAEHCCGSAGVYSLIEPEMSQQVLSSKLDALNALDADVIATANPGCIMQIGAGQLRSRAPRPVVHPIELLDLSYDRAGYYSDASDA
jgi:glycolate oxidase iron-sulfur subunit